MKYDLKYPSGVVYEFTLEEILRDARAGKLSGDCRVRPLGTQQEYMSVSTLIGPCPSPQSECYVSTDGQRQGPFLPEQLRSMWRAGTVTAAATVSWDGLTDPIKLSSLMDNPLFNTPTHDSAPSADRKAIGAVVAGLGVLLVIFAVVQLNSIESQLKRGFGQTDEIPLILLCLGVPAALAGFYMFFAPPTSK